MVVDRVTSSHFHSSCVTRVICLLRDGMHQFTKHFAMECLAFLFSLEMPHHFHHSLISRFYFFSSAPPLSSFSWEEFEIGAIIQNLLQCQRVYIILHNSISNIGCSVDWSQSTYSQSCKSEKPHEHRARGKNNKIKWNFWIRNAREYVPLFTCIAPHFPFTQQVLIIERGRERERIA